MSWQEEMVSELSKAKNGDKTYIMKRYETMTGKTRPHLYKVAKRHTHPGQGSPGHC
jgi:predicted DNA-binding transcriptional regulator AlpA